MEKTWRCTVCGYLHTGDQPPDICPVCKADASKFELVEPAENKSVDRFDALRHQAKLFIDEMKAAFVPHAVAAHFPNALLPTCFLFLIIYIFSGQASFETTTFYLLLVIFVAVPPTFVFGLLDWKLKYSGELTPIFRKKIIFGTLLLVLSFIVTAWRWSNPEVLTAGGLSACAYSILILLMLACVVVLGHYGGLLVFGKK